ncbi:MULTISPECIES: ThiF family adenylyltransferase [Ralstonia]|jgi:Dinucleotide-utilizing enzymes involved in molybdopterin and thiamine biosynthesis family 2|uniref:ThiF family adenylyltransferase n=1 Tax=Ralstonia TaxID=48736 RepID=UPI00040E1297|nr:ThiF family adenylyltransferase [Ralstonia pickettii]WKZ88687.1 ThiF family adenylyltransferase [Ralstonia pickettii]
MTAMKTELDQLADRHLRADPQGVLLDTSQAKSGIVLVHVSSRMAAALGTQHLVWMLVSLLSRQFKVVTEIILDMPKATLHQGVAPFGEKDTLLETLEECIRLISGPHIRATRIEAGSAPDLALVIGSEAVASPRRLQLYADGWRYFVGVEGDVPDVPPVSDLSIGPYLCASYAAGEVFKLLRGMKPGKGDFITAHFASSWTRSSANTWAELIDGPSAEQFGALPHFYFAGAGAVAQAAALCLGTSRFAGSCSVVDKDELDLTNDNRYALSTRNDDGKSKVGLMQRYLRSAGFDCQAVSDWWQTFVTSRGKHAPNDDIRALEQAYKFPIVLSCVDKNDPRHALQNGLPRLIIGGSADGLSAKASIFDLGAGTACLKCHNPLLSRNAIIQERIAALRQLDGERRTAHARELGLTEEDVEHLLAPGGCGKLSEADLDRFAAGSPEMSVGFVSAAAGVLLVVQFLRYLHLGAVKSIQDGTMAVATFARAKIRSMNVALEHGCDCSQHLRAGWAKHWSGSYRA